MSETHHPPASVDSTPESEYRAIHESAAIYDRAYVDALVLTGDDRIRFLNGQITCDVTSLSPGASTYGFFTTGKGRIEADVTVLGLEDRLWLEVPAGTGTGLLERLRKYIIFDQVTAEPLDARPLALIGPNATDVLARIETDDLTVSARDGGFELWTAATESREEVVQRLRNAGAMAIGSDAWERHRVETGRPRWGNDFGLDCFPQETGIERAVSYTKGCYLGQEVVARIHYRGGVQRRLRGLRIQSESPNAELVDAELKLDGKTVGRLGSLTHTPAGTLGLSVIHDKATVGSTVALVSGEADRGTAQIVELPFEPA